MRVRPCVLVAWHILTIAIAGGGAVVEAQVADISTTLDGPSVVASGDVATITIGYSNAGPNTAISAYAGAFLPSGVPARFDEMTTIQFDALQASVVPDGLGNTAVLFVDNFFCENMYFQVEQDDGDPLVSNPIVGLDPGVSAGITFDLEIPMEPPEIAALIIDEPSALAGEFKAAEAGDMWLTASDWGRYTRGTCEFTPADCSDLSGCFGPRLSYIDPIEAAFELADDGSADPTFGCQPLIGFTPGRIAVMERGVCEFGTKGLNAQNAGAVAVLMVNDLRCSTEPDSSKCAINMGGGADGYQVTIPLVMLSVDDGQPIIDTLVAATPVRGRLGPVSNALTLDGWALLTDLVETDPDLENNYSTRDLDVSGVFIDGFELGDTSSWSGVFP